MTDLMSISGTLSTKDLKRLTGATRSGTIGPTTVYYAGVTAPIISAGVAVVTRNVMHNVNGISDYWIWFISCLIAAFSGIAWYLIFIRWSYRHSHGRGDEGSTQTALEITDNHLIVKRGQITTHIGWPAIQEIRENRNFITLLINGNDTLIVPNRWFGKDKTACQQFRAELKSRAQI